MEQGAPYLEIFLAISYVGIGTRVESSSASPQTLAYPTLAASGDFLIACMHHRATTTAMAAPSNGLTWTEVVTSITYMRLYTATYDGLTAAPTMDPASTNSYGIMLAIRAPGVISLDKASDIGATQTNMRYPALAPGNSNEFVLTYCRTNSAITSVAPDTGWTEIEDWNVTLSTGGVQLCYQIQGTATAIAAGNPVITGGSSAAVHGITAAFTEAAVPSNPARIIMLGVG